MEVSVQEMVKRPIHDIPTRYLVDQEPAIPSSPEEKSFPGRPGIPVLDLKALLAEENHVSQIEKLHSTCKEWGIFQVVNHGVDGSLMEKLKHEIEDFYKLPLEERLKYRIKDGEVEGYGQSMIVSADQKVDWADRFFMITNPIRRRQPHLFPELPSSLRETLEAYISELQALSRAIFGLIAEALKLEEGEVAEMFEDGMQALRMTYYPPCPQPDQVMGLGAHSDATGITVLHQVNGVEGLQIRKDGVWMPVSFLPDAFVVNLGDITEMMSYPGSSGLRSPALFARQIIVLHFAVVILSNGLYKSIEHRATVNPEKERITLAMFFNCKYEAEVGPSRSLLTEEQRPLYRRLIMEQYMQDFFSRKLNGKSYLDCMKI